MRRRDSRELDISIATFTVQPCTCKSGAATTEVIVLHVNERIQKDAGARVYGIATIGQMRRAGSTLHVDNPDAVQNIVIFGLVFVCYASRDAINEVASLNDLTQGTLIVHFGH
jgi:hypothetical protein